VLLGSGLNVATLWTQLSFVQMSLLLLYHLVTVHALWPAPIYAWLLLVSGWARRAAFLWAVLPLLAIGVFEKIVFHTSHFAAMMGNRMSGGGAEAFTVPGTFPMDPMTHLTPGNFLSSPGLWIGLAIAAALLAAAVRLRRYHGPIRSVTYFLLQSTPLGDTNMSSQAIIRERVATNRAGPLAG